MTVEAREFRVEIAFLFHPEDGDTLLLGKVPAGSTWLYGPRLSRGARFFEWAYSVTAEGPAPTLHLAIANEHGQEISLIPPQ